MPISRNATSRCRRSSTGVSSPPTARHVAQTYRRFVRDRTKRYTGQTSGPSATQQKTHASKRDPARCTARRRMSSTIEIAASAAKTNQPVRSIESPIISYTYNEYIMNVQPKCCTHQVTTQFYIRIWNMRTGHEQSSLVGLVQSKYV